MSIHDMDFQQCQNFVDMLGEIEDGKYISAEGEGEHVRFAAREIKDARFGTKQIADVSERCLALLQEEKPSSYEYAKKLEKSLRRYSNRVRRSIEGKWWHFVVRFFGYEPKSLKNVTEVLNKLQNWIRKSDWMVNQEIERVLWEIELVGYGVDRVQQVESPEERERLLEEYINRREILSGRVAQLSKTVKRDNARWAKFSRKCAHCGRVYSELLSKFSSLESDQDVLPVEISPEQRAEIEAAERENEALRRAVQDENEAILALAESDIKAARVRYQEFDRVYERWEAGEKYANLDKSTLKIPEFEEISREVRTLKREIQDVKYNMLRELYIRR